MVIAETGLPSVVASLTSTWHPVNWCVRTASVDWQRLGGVRLFSSVLASFTSNQPQRAKHHNDVEREGEGVLVQHQEGEERSMLSFGCYAYRDGSVASFARRESSARLASKCPNE